MKDIDIFKWLYDLEPENSIQKKKLNKMMSIILEKTEPTKIDIFLDTLALDEVMDKEVSRVYEYYLTWCKENIYEPESKITFGRKVCETFKVKSVAITRDGESKRVYKLEEL